jgi:phage/plasmid-like protein (TIGR03299 family)
MAHDIWNDGTQDAMFVVGERQDAWHQLGQRCVNAPNWQEAIKLAGLDWTVSKVQNWAMAPGSQKATPVDSFSIFRDSDKKQIGTVGAGFAVMQNKDCFQFVDCLLEANGGSHYDSAGALGNGATIWCSVRVPKADITIVGGDKHESYLLFATAHDGSMAHTVKLTTVRVVCRNTLNSALREAGAICRVKHTMNGHARLERVKQLMQGVTVDAKKLEEKLNVLAQRKMTRESLVAIMNRLFPKPKEENASNVRRENVLTDVLGLYANNDKDAFPEIKGTAYNLLNSVTEYVDHFRTARMTKAREGMSLSQMRAENAVLDGSGDKLKSSALAVIDEVTSVMPAPYMMQHPIIDPMNDSQFLKAMGISL